MSSITVFVGLDYHQRSVEVCVEDGAGRVLGNRACDNEAGRIGAFVERFGQPVRAAIEACTGAAAPARRTTA